MSEHVGTKRKKQLVFPLVLTGEEDRARIQALAKHLGCAQSEAVRRLIEVVVDSLEAPSTKDVLDRVAALVTQPWERRQ